MIETIIFILWIVIFILTSYFLIQLLRLNSRLHSDLKELEETEELFNIEYQDYKNITFELEPDENGTIFDKNGKSYRLERKDEHRK